MKKTLRNLGVAVVAFALLALLLDGLIGWAQPTLESGEAEGVLRVYDAEGQLHETRLIVIEDGDTLWIQSGHHFRGWYHRMRRYPDVELERAGQVRPYRAVALDTPEAREHVAGLIKQRAGTFGFYAIRTFLLFAEIKPVRLDPRS